MYEANFSWALAELKKGARLARSGWNGKGQWVQIQVSDVNSRMTLPYFYLHTAQGDLVPWLPSQTDLMAIDWVEAAY